ncbi:hypothetical protein WH47_05757 [Habropoda laboriosa]|uniref:Uncharacterized protein n=1 Tax=Habropoda laboriosa TaxID=597456 RepID=A0A0L7QSK1_9HYME|nr:hypothetical protein WH47_05757 [Habropoda laboriosa]
MDLCAYVCLSELRTEEQRCFVVANDGRSEQRVAKDVDRPFGCRVPFILKSPIPYNGKIS